MASELSTSIPINRRPHPLLCAAEDAFRDFLSQSGDPLPDLVHLWQRDVYHDDSIEFGTLFSNHMTWRWRVSRLTFISSGPLRSNWAGAVQSIWDELRERETEQGQKAEARSLELLKSWLSTEQRACYERNHWFEVKGNKTGRRYRIDYGRTFNVAELDECGMAIAILCFAPADMPATGDVMLAQKIALECDEKAALKVANRKPCIYLRG